MARYLLDTNILSQLIRDPAGPIAAAISRVGEANICTSIVVACALRFGAAKRAAPALSARVDSLLATIPVLPLEAGCDERYARIRADLEARGLPIGGNDLLIAAQALSAECIVVTDNVGEFNRVAGLGVQNWLPG